MRFIIYSGGMDSYTLLHYIISLYHKNNVRALSFFYGQRHRKELIQAKRVTSELGIPHKFIDLSDVFFNISASALVNKNIKVPEGHYEAASMKQTVVPGRNTIMLSVAMGIAENWSIENGGECSYIYYGAHAGDHAIYPDCRPEYVESINNLADKATDGTIQISAPFINKTKGEILAEGIKLGLDYKNTWTCYAGKITPCGKCGACVERAQAFAEHNMKDPLLD